MVLLLNAYTRVHPFIFLFNTIYIVICRISLVTNCIKVFIIMNKRIQVKQRSENDVNAREGGVMRVMRQTPHHAEVEWPYVQRDISEHTINSDRVQGIKHWESPSSLSSTTTFRNTINTQDIFRVFIWKRCWTVASNQVRMMLQKIKNNYILP